MDSLASNPCVFALTTGVISSFIGGLLLARIRHQRGQTFTTPISISERVTVFFRIAMFGVLSATVTWGCWVALARVDPSTQNLFGPETAKELWFFFRLILFVLGIYAAFVRTLDER